MTLALTNTQILSNLDAPLAHDVLTQAEYETFRDALPTWRDRLIAMVLRNTGLRINEVLALPVRHCALDGPASIIYVQRSKKRRVAEYESMYINPGLGVQIRDYIKGQQMALTEQVFGNQSSTRGSTKITARGLALRLRKGRNCVNRPAGSAKRIPELLCPDYGGRRRAHGYRL